MKFLGLVTQFLSLSPHLGDVPQQLSGVVALKAVGSLVFGTMDVVVSEELIHKAGPGSGVFVVWE